ncbi:MAG: hypothetical protein M1831_004340 [Alyxoria varia]|nr:MAG: hypothetical protein M1831_004340 [Alyxoria varia]
MATKMKGMAVNYGAKKLLNSKIDEKRKNTPAGDDDPFFTYVTKPNGKKKKVKKQIPDYIPQEDAESLAKAKARAYKMDLGFINKGPIKIGWSAFIAFILPEIGDFFDLAFAIWIFRTCCHVKGGIPGPLRKSMIWNIIIDFLIGLIPFVGDLADVAYRCNTKNVMIMEKHLIQKYGPKSQTEAQKENARLEEVDDSDDSDDDEKRAMPNTASAQPQQPVPAATRDRQGFGSKFFGSGANREQDVEKGRAARY